MRAFAFSRFGGTGSPVPRLHLSRRDKVVYVHDLRAVSTASNCLD